MVKKSRIEKEFNKIENNVEKEFNKIENNVEKEFKEFEQWVVERKKFFIKLGWIAGIIVVLLVASKLYLSTNCFG